MFTYIQIIDKDSCIFKGYVDYKITKGILSMTEVRGFKTLHHIDIPIASTTDFEIGKLYGNDRVSFIYQGRRYYFINTGYGESQYLEHHLNRAVNA